VRAQICKDLETNAVPETCLLGLHEVMQHLPMAMQGFSDFYTSLEHCQNCSGEMAAAKIPKNWFYVRLAPRFLFLSIYAQADRLMYLIGTLSLQFTRLVRAADTQHYPKTFERLLLQRH